MNHHHERAAVLERIEGDSAEPPEACSARLRDERLVVVSEAFKEALDEFKRAVAAGRHVEAKSLALTVRDELQANHFGTMS